MLTEKTIQFQTANRVMIIDLLQADAPNDAEPLSVNFTGMLLAVILTGSTVFFILLALNFGWQIAACGYFLGGLGAMCAVILRHYLKTSYCRS
jgi:uncharacterized YccA/Bax inhibitor family protein